MDFSFKEDFPDNGSYPTDHTYNGNPDIKGKSVQLQWTPEMIQEYQKCAKDPIYFIERWMTVFHIDKGMVPFVMYDYQKELIHHLHDNRFNITLACRQSGKSITTIGYILWYALFSTEPKKIAIAANKGDTAREMLERLMDALEQIPFFLQLGCDEYNKSSIRFENKTKIFAAATSSSSIRGKSCSLLYLDEFAFVENDESFYTSTYPVVSSGTTSKIMITSTANGIGNSFYNIWQGATTGTNNYKGFRVDWFDVPGRDEQWKKETIANTSEIQFMQEFSNDFLGTGNTLINANAIMAMTTYDPIWVKEMVKLYKEPEEGHQYAMAVDVAKGRGQDRSTFHIIDITTKPFEQVGTLCDAMISPLLLPTLLWKYARMYNDAYVIIESNDQGMVVCNGLYYDLEYDNMYVSSMVKRDGLGLEMNKKTKRIGCSHLKDLIEEKKLLIRDKETIQEFTTFAAKGASYEAEDGHHDDLVMALVGFAYITSTPIFLEMTDTEIKGMLYQERMKQIEDEVTPFGIIDDGRGEETYTDSSGQQWNIDSDYKESNADAFDGWQSVPPPGFV